MKRCSPDWVTLANACVQARSELRLALLDMAVLGGTYLDPEQRAGLERVRAAICGACDRLTAAIKNRHAFEPLR